MARPIINFRFDPRLSRELRKQSKTIAKGLACVIITSLLTSLTIPLIRMIVAGIQSGDMVRLGWLCLGVISVFAIKYTFTRGQTWYLSKAAALMIADIRIRLFAKLQRLPVSYFSERRSGNIQSVLTNDVSVYQSAVSIVRDSIDGPIKAVGAAVAVVVMSWQLAVVALLFVPLLGIVIQKNGRKMKEAQARVQDDVAELIGVTNEALGGVRVVKAFAAEDRIQDSYTYQVRKSYDSQMRAVGRLASLRPLVEFIGACALATVLFLCGWLTKTSNFSVGDMAALVYALDVINQGFRTLGYANSTYNQVLAATDRMHTEILDVPDDHLGNLGGQVIPEFEGRVEFRNVTFSYPDGTRALDNVSFTIEPGTSLALVGPSGAGKSTIADLMLRFYDPTDGTILLDGVDIKLLDVVWLRAQFGVVPQQTFLFAGTLADNLRFGKPDATPDEMLDAASAAHALSFVHRSPEAFEAQIGEHGSGLSGGEKQRLAIARALIRKPKILLLDEATSALDAESEKLVQEALDEIMLTRTTLFIAHRLTTAARADRILMLGRGQVLEEGSHRDLVERNGAYAGMYRAFTSGVLDGAIG